MVYHRLIAIIVVISTLTAAITIVSGYILQIYCGCGLYVTIGIIISLYLLFPFLFHWSSLFQRHMLFMHLFQWSFGFDYYNPKRHNMYGGRDFFLESESDGKIGVWHILPKSSIGNISVDSTSNDYDTLLKESGHPIVIYFHGNMGTRATGHRVDLYRLLQNENFHIVAFDYRGFGNSTSLVPTESSLLEDGLCVYKWVRANLGQDFKIPVFLWGHSMGTCVVVHLAADLCTQRIVSAPSGIILEATFTNMKDAVLNTVMTMIYRPLPGRKWILGSTLKKNDIAFENDCHIRNVTIPMVFLHATLDMVIPYKLGKNLYEIACSSHPEDNNSIWLKTFKGESRSSGHVFIWKEPDLPNIIQEFVSLCQSVNSTT